jgi:hypothetical protein
MVEVDIEDCSELDIEKARELELPSLDKLDTEFTLTLNDAPSLP